MSEKPEALRFEVWRDRETEILRVSNTGEFLWHKDADARIANPGPDANPAMMHLFRALRQAEVIRQENERLRGLLTEAQKAVWMNYDGDLLDRIEAALKEMPR